MEIKLDAEAVAGIASAAIFDSLSQESRDSVIKQALQHLLTPEENRGRFGPGETPLQQAFNQAVQAAAYRIVREKIENDQQVQEGILKLLGPLLISSMEAEAEANFDSSLAETLGKALGTWLAEQARKNGR